MSPGSWRYAATLARRDLHRSLRGLRLLFLCLFLGVATLAGIGSLSASITRTLADQGRVILGGDLQAGMTQRLATPDEHRALRSVGTLSETVRLRAMARSQGPGQPAVLSELKAVDGFYPLYGRLMLESGPAAGPPPANSIYVDRALAERLQVGIGSAILYGAATFRIAGIIADEPDRVGEGFTLGPVAIVSPEGMRRTGLIQPGSLFVAKYRIRLPSGAAPDEIIDRLKDDFPSSSWEFRTRDRAAPGASRFFDRMGQFLSLIGLAALVIAGIGVSNGVSSYLHRKREGIATLKALGASAADIARLYFVQIGLIAAAAVLAGLAVGALVPILAIALAGDALPVKPEFALYGAPLAASAAYGLLIAFLFVLPPLARARSEPVASLFRDALGERAPLGRRPWLLAALAAAAIVALAVASSDEPVFAAWVLAAIAATLLLLAGIGWTVRRLARNAPRPRRPFLRLALSALHRPGAQTVALVVALGLALTLFVTLAAIQTSLDAEIKSTVPARAPDQFVLDIPSEQRRTFEQLVRRHGGAEADLNIVPTLRGTITAFGRQRVADLEQLPEDAWFLRGERGVTYSEALPEGSDLVAGNWWPPGYRGPPLVSIDQEAATTMGIGVGDTLTVSVLGREIEARIASLRRVNWDTMGFNYILVFPPSTLEAAPHNLAATIALDDRRRGALARALLSAFPSASIIDVGEVIAQVDQVLSQMAVAILIAASVTILAGIAVLIGALAASRQARLYDSVLLKTLGATRRQILGAQAIEYGLIALVVSLVSLALGLAGAWFVIVQIFDFGWRPDWAVVLTTLFVGAGLTIGLALLGSLPLLSVRPARALRHL